MASVRVGFSGCCWIKRCDSQDAHTKARLGEDAYGDTPSKWCGEGDQVIFAKYSGLLWDGLDGKKYRVLNDLDVVAILD